MDPAKVLEITHDLFLTSDILVDDLKEDMREKMKEGQYDKLAKFFIYRLIIEINEYPIYDKIRPEMVKSGLSLAMLIDIYGFKDPLNIEQFTNLMYKFFKYLLENRLNVRLDKERWELIEAKLFELKALIQK
jgi:hypothetical protein